MHKIRAMSRLMRNARACATGGSPGRPRADERHAVGVGPRGLSILVVLTLLVASGLGNAQTVEITPFYGWQFGGGFGVRDGTVDIKADPVFGVMVDVRVRADATLEFIYSRQETMLELRSTDALRPRVDFFDVNVEYFQAGGVYEFLGEGAEYFDEDDDKPAVRPFIVLTLGATRFSPSVGGTGAGSDWRFSLGFGGGVKVFASKRLGFRLDARAWPTFVAGGGAFFCSLPGGCLFAFGGSASWQASATAGLIVAF